MLGIEPNTQRPRMDEAIGVIVRLLTSSEPLTCESDWFKLRDARLHLRPFTQPHMPLVVAAAGSPSGMVMAGKYGLGVLSISNPRGEGVTLNDFWAIAENTAAEHGKSVNRDEWRLVLHVHLAETREQALDQVRSRAGTYWREYFEGTMGFPRPFDGAKEQIVDEMNARRAWCIGTPDDLVDTIRGLDESSGGFGGLLVQAVEWATREQTLHSYELIARYVKPRFQGSLLSLTASQEDAAQVASKVRILRDEAVGRARESYEEGSVPHPPV
jgi:limonene 1,2-monooxygenase